MAISAGVLLGYIVVVASCCMKLPQVFTIIKKKSGFGISISSFTIEIALYAITFCYSYQSGLDFSTYAENLFLMIQDILIVFFTLYFAQQLKDKKVIQTVIIFVIVFPVLMFKNEIIFKLLNILQLLTTPFFIICKVPQIYESYKNKSTGSLSLVTTCGLLVGNLVRIFTTITEAKGDLGLLLPFIAGAALNSTIIFQILYYGDKPKDEKKDVKNENEEKKD